MVTIDDTDLPLLKGDVVDLAETKLNKKLLSDPVPIKMALICKALSVFFRHATPGSTQATTVCKSASEHIAIPFLNNKR